MKCEWCEVEVLNGKEYDMLIIPSNKIPFKFGEQIFAVGHKNCLSQLYNAYKMFGKILSKSASELEIFDASNYDKEG